jgi:hypothetical protein
MADGEVSGSKLLAYAVAFLDAFGRLDTALDLFHHPLVHSVLWYIGHKLDSIWTDVAIVVFVYFWPRLRRRFFPGPFRWSRIRNARGNPRWSG